MSNNILKASALEKLEKLGLTKDEVLALVDDGEETVAIEDGSPEKEERKSWQHIFMEEHRGYYNKRYGTNYTFQEYYDGVVNETIKVHYKWKELLGLEPVDLKGLENVTTNKQKFIDSGIEID